MKIKLLDYKGEPTFVDIPDNTEKISIIIVSGNMIMTYPVICDSCSESRTSSLTVRVYFFTFGAVLAAGSLVEEAQRPAAPEHTKRLR